jgi:translation initiation factor 1 (eIF-1/SUI1)
MNPFDDYENNTTTTASSLDQSKVEIWIEEYGRKKKTCVSGWNIDDKTINDHLKKIKTSKGCNGTYKEKIIQLQGNHIDFIKKYIEDTGVCDDNIYIKG